MHRPLFSPLYCIFFHLEVRPFEEKKSAEIDEKVDEKPFSGALEALRNFRKMRKEIPDFDASF